MSTGLLVSVRDAAEAADALSAGVDLIDLKEPRRGPLGPLDVAMMAQVVELVAGRAPISAALGELLEGFDVSTLPPGIQWAKFGLAGCAHVADWPQRLHAVVSCLPAGTHGVAVIYADWSAAAAPAPRAVTEQARSAGCRAVLVDTCHKQHGGLLDAWSVDECRLLLEELDRQGLRSVFAGSLRRQDILRLLPLTPDFVAVRGAVCEGDRAGRISPRLVQELAMLVRDQSMRKVVATDLASD